MKHKKWRSAGQVLEQGRGCRFVPTLAREIHTRDDLDERCLYELDERVNLYFHRNSVKDPQKPGLYLAAVNPDGDRKNPNDRLCFWHPRDVALRFKERYVTRDMMDPDPVAQAIATVMAWRAAFQQDSWNRILLQETLLREIKKREEDERQLQLEWEQEQLGKEC